MTAFDRKWRPCGGIETFERLQHGERDDALAIWRTFPNLVTAVAGSDRCHVFRRIGKKILQRVAAAGGARARSPERKCGPQFCFCAICPPAAPSRARPVRSPDSHLRPPR